jgi:hypothetical protein
LDGSDDFMVLNDDIDVTKASIFIVANKTSKGSGYQTILTTENHLILGRDNNTNEWAAWYNEAYLSGVTLDETYRILSHRERAADDHEVFTDGGTQQTFSSGTFHSPKVGTLGSNNVNSSTDATQNFPGNIAEVLFYDRVVDDAERTIIENYLSSKYGIGLTAGDKYSHDGTYDTDVAGIGRATSSETHLSSNSSILEFSTGSFAADGDYVMVGHDGASKSSFGYESTEPVNGLSGNAERMAREWRADFTSISGTKTVTVSVSGGDLPSKQAGYEYLLFVDSGDAFNNSLETYTLKDGGGGSCEQGDATCSATVSLSDDDYLTIGAGKRVVNFTTTSGSALENTSASPNASVTAKLNLPYPASSGTSVDVAFTSTGDIASPAGIQESGGGNDNGDYEASGSDYSAESSPVTIAAGASTEDISLTLSDDGDIEQTEKFEVVADGASTTNAGVGADDRFVFSILDDDEPRDVQFADSDYTDNTDNDPNYSPTSTEGDGGTVRTEQFTVQLVQDGNGETAATGAPCTSVKFTVDGASTATVGTDLSDPTIDFRIKNESDPGGTCPAYQERLSATEGRVYFGDGASDATLKLEINEDDIDDASSEDIILNLDSPISSALATSKRQTTFAISDDDSAPAVQFAQSSSSGDESTSPTLTVNLSSQAGQEVTVNFGLDTETSTDPEETTATQGAGNDFTIDTSSPLSFPVGTTSQTISITVNDDDEAELAEDVVIDLSSPSGAALGTPDSHTYTIKDNDAAAIGSSGPGGVGGTDGAGDQKLKLWLRANDLSLSDGSDVSSWADASGQGNGASQSTASEQPTYRTNVLNGRAVVELDGSDDRMKLGDNFDTKETSIFVVANKTSTGSDYQTLLATERRLILGRGQGTNQWAAWYDGAYLSGITLNSTYRILSHRGRSATDHGLHTDGGNAKTFSNGAYISGKAGTLGSNNGGSESNTSQHYPGNVAEVTYYSASLNDTRRVLVENYLSAKYDIALDGGNKYAGDDGGSGNYDRGVFGIGRTSSNDFHIAAETDGLRFELNTGLDNDDYLLAGHRTSVNAVNASDISGVSGTLEGRFERAWYTDLTDGGTGLTVDVTFDLSNAGLEGPAGDAANYILVQRTADTNNDWSAVQNGADAVTGDEITFNGVSLTDGQEITLATTDAANSPLDANSLVVEGTAGTDGADQGWRYLGLPVTGGTAGDLLRADGSQFIDFDVEWMAYTNPGGSVQQGSGDMGWTAVQDASAALTNGRGFILWLYDDVTYPLDPSITLQTAGGLAGPGASNVTVGSGSADDPTLAQSDKQFLLANPYAVPYDLGSLNGSGFDDVVQVWEANATSPADGDDGNAGSFVTRSRSGNDEVASWQGFLLTRSSTGSGDTQVTFNSGGRTPTATPSLVGSKAATETQAPEKHRVPLRLVGRDDGGTITAIDRAISVLFHESATDGRDRYDAPKFEPMASSYATLAPVSATDSVLRAQESRPLPTKQQVRVPLSFQVEGVSGTFEIRMPSGGDISTETPSVPDDWAVTLVDTKGTADPGDDETHTLTPGGTPYTFEVAGSKSALTSEAKAGATADSSDERDVRRPTLRRLRRPAPRGSEATAKASAKVASSSRFALTIERTGALPVEMADLGVRRDGEQALVTWETASETGNAGFRVQHQRLPVGDTTAAPAPSDWTTVGFVEGAGTTTKTQTYRYETGDLDYGRHVFRLEQVDIDGTKTPTEPVGVQMRLESSHAVEAPYPNPATQTAILPVTVREGQQVTVSIYDVLGRRVRVAHSREVPPQKTHRLSLRVRDLTSGSYFVRVRGETFTVTRRLTIVR